MIIAAQRVCTLVAALLLVACASTAPERAEPAPESSNAASAILDNPLLDGLFVAPGSDFSHYTQLLVTELQLDDWRRPGVELPLKAMNTDDRRFFREQYVSALVHYLIADGSYSLSTEPGPDVLRLDASLHQRIRTPEGVTNPSDPRAIVVMLLNLEFYDSTSGELLATLTDRQAIGRVGQRDNNPVAAAQVRRAFSYWMQTLKEELDLLRGLN